MRNPIYFAAWLAFILGPDALLTADTWERIEIIPCVRQSIMFFLDDARLFGLNPRFGIGWPSAMQ